MNVISRRRFLQTNLQLATGLLTGLTDPSPFIMTVSGKVPASSLGKSLTHEHVLVDFVGANQVSPQRYNADEVFRTALPYLQQLKSNGCTAVFECTPSYLGRDVKLLRRLSEASGLHLITNTGFYGAAGQKYLPEQVFNESAEQIAADWIREWKEGIDGTGIRPGFLKLGVDNTPFSEAINKIITAGAITHLNTGLTIGIHTSNGHNPAMEELRILAALKVSPEAWVWIHAQNEKDIKWHIEAAERGGWISFDGISKEAVQENIFFLSKMKENKLLQKVLISQDAGWYHVGEAGGGHYRNYNDLFDHFLPALKKAGFTDGEMDLLLVNNPARAFQVRVRSMK